MYLFCKLQSGLISIGEVLQVPNSITSVENSKMLLKDFVNCYSLFSISYLFN